MKKQLWEWMIVFLRGKAFECQLKYWKWEKRLNIRNIHLHISHWADPTSRGSCGPWLRASSCPIRSLLYIWLNLLYCLTSKHRLFLVSASWWGFIFHKTKTWPTDKSILWVGIFNLLQQLHGKVPIKRKLNWRSEIRGSSLVRVEPPPRTMSVN